MIHAMGGMSRTSLAAEAAHWWTRSSGLFRDGALLRSTSEQYSSADRVITVLGEYCEGPRFHQQPRHRTAPAEPSSSSSERAVLMVWDNYESVLPQFNIASSHHATPYMDEDRHRLADLFHDHQQAPARPSWSPAAPAKPPSPAP